MLYLLSYQLDAQLGGAEENYTPRGATPQQSHDSASHNSAAAGPAPVRKKLAVAASRGKAAW